MQNNTLSIVPGKIADQYFFMDDGVFPNSRLPVLLYKQVLQLPVLGPAQKVKRMFQQNGWTNNWKSGIYTCQHYHSNTHEAIGVIKGKTLLLLGGEDGLLIPIEKNDVIVIPAGVAHKNMGDENAVTCIGGYYNGKNFDMNYGNPEERPTADKMIADVPLPEAGPVAGADDILFTTWLYAKLFP